jgi:predicted HAD superfamily phosphohydrolase
MDRSGVVLTTVGHGFTEAELDRIAEEARHFQPAAASLRELLDRFQSQASRLAQ